MALEINFSRALGLVLLKLWNKPTAIKFKDKATKSTA